MLLDIETLRFIMTESDEVAAIVLDNILDNYLSGKKKEIAGSSLKTTLSIDEVRHIIINNGIERISKIEKEIAHLLDKYSTKKEVDEEAPDLERIVNANRNEGGDAQKEEEERNADFAEKAATIESSPWLTPLEKQAFFIKEDRGGNMELLVGLSRKAIWHYRKLAMAKVRMLRVMGVDE